MYKKASRSRHVFSGAPSARSACAALASVAHAGQIWEQPKRGSTWGHPSNKNFKLHYSDSNEGEPKSITRARAKAAKQQKTKVYIIRFEHESGLKFLKIGITNHLIEERFSNDVGRYKIELVRLLIPIRRKDALILENALHNHFKGRSIRPPVPLLSGGNSECFSYDADLEIGMAKLIDQVLGYHLAGIAQPVEHSPRK